MKGREWRRKVDELAARYGYEVGQSNGGHLRLTKPGHRVVFTSQSTSDWRTLKNLESQLRRNQPKGTPQ